MASENLYDKFLGLIFYFAGYNVPWVCPSTQIEAYFNGEMRGSLLNRAIGSPAIGVLYYCIPSELWGVVDFGQIDGSYAQFKLTLQERWLQWGIRIIYKQLEDDLKVEIQDHQLIDLAFLYEVSHDSIDPEAKTSGMYNDSSIKIDLLKNLQESSHVNEGSPIEINPLKNLGNCHMSTEEHSQRGSKRKHEFIFPQDKRIKTMLTSNSNDGDENEMRMIDLLKNLHL